MPFPLIPVIISVVATLVGGSIVAATIYSFNNADVGEKTDVTILFIGETEAGKDTVMELIKTGEFLNESRKTPKYEAIKTTVKNKKIKIINTSGSDSTFKDVEEAKNLHHNIRCYIFDASKFYKGENIIIKLFLRKLFPRLRKKQNRIKLGIQNTIDECKEKNIKCISLGTRGDKVNKEKIENEVRSMGIDCSIFELSKKPQEQVIEFLFKEYL